MTTRGSQKPGLAALFASASLARLLGVFMREPQRRFYQRELERLTGTPLRQLQRDLSRLEKSGLVSKTPSGNRSYYQAVDAHPAFGDLRRVLVKTVGLGDALRAAIEPLGASVAAAFIFGSFAAGDDSAESDVDLLVIGAVSRRVLATALADVSRDLGRELNPVIFSPREFSRRLRSGDHFVTATLAEPRIWIIGDEQTVAALA
jgi:predicted nucleotidyltransferase